MVGEALVALLQSNNLLHTPLKNNLTLQTGIQSKDQNGF